ncbi:unnamed protein product [Brassicogethes aeneus]|uniref:Uncharacterized protein n=1 Tax=Brassicogethes aeneus TaxID=1431903 RepID=A0A9P0BHM1_BRAAE|nr:unnamed protein product [Brassicogethes aeneus]
MGAYPVLLLASVLFVGSNAQCCNKNLIPDLSFKVSGSLMTFPCDSTKNIYINAGRYVPQNVIATRMQIYKENAIVALPRYKHGVPFTLARFSLKNKGCKAPLEPFPCWSLQEEGNCEAMQNVVDIVADGNDILWVLDIGITNTLEQPVRRCAPKLFAIKLDSGNVVNILDLTPFASAESRLQTLAIDYAPDGRAFAYISDAGTGSIIVYDIVAKSGYKVVLPESILGNTPVKDVLYMALTRQPCGNVLYFTYLSSPRLYSIKSSLLQTGKASGSIVDLGLKPQGQPIVLLGTDNGAALFFRYKGESDIYIWNSATPFKCENFLLVQNGGECRLPTQVVPGYKQLMWAIESNFHDFIVGTDGCMGPSVAVHPLIKTE